MSLPLVSSNPKDQLGIRKVPLHLNPPAALIYMALGFWDGAVKYGPFNWREEKVSFSVYYAATMRHLLALLDGEWDASDSGKPHLAHALACLAIIADAYENGTLVDDRPKPGAAPRLLEEWREENKKEGGPGPTHGPQPEEGQEDGGSGQGEENPPALLWHLLEPVVYSGIRGLSEEP